MDRKDDETLWRFIEAYQTLSQAGKFKIHLMFFRFAVSDAVKHPSWDKIRDTADTFTNLVWPFVRPFVPFSLMALLALLASAAFLASPNTLLLLAGGCLTGAALLQYPKQIKIDVQ